MRYTSRRNLRVLVPICLMVSLIAACEKGAAPAGDSRDEPADVSRATPSAASVAAPMIQPVAAVKADITPQEAKALLDANDGYVYLDVRTVDEFAAGHVPGSLNIPILVRKGGGGHSPNSKFLSITQAVLSKDAKVVVGCRSGARSKRAQEAMKSIGYGHTSNMLGGFSGKGDRPGWSSLGYPVETGDGGEKSYAGLRARATP